MKRKRLIAAAAVCLVLAFTAGIWAVKYRASQIKLSDNSVHVTARYTEYDPKSEACERLVQLTEEELFRRIIPRYSKEPYQKSGMWNLGLIGRKVIVQLQKSKWKKSTAVPAAWTAQWRL